MKRHNHRVTLACRRVVGTLALLVLPVMLRADLPPSYLYVSTGGADSQNYGTGYTDLQAAINASTAGDTVWIEDGFVCNSGGTYVSSAGATNRIVIDKAITVHSVSGTKENAAVIVGAHHVPGVTINGPGSIRCLYVSAAASVIGLQLTNGATSASTAYGGGAYLVSGGTGTIFSNCLIVANNAATYGGGVYGGGIFSHCAIVANYASTRAGGVYGATLRHCEITDNTTSTASGNGGGIYDGTAEYCRFAGNYARVGGGAYSGTLSDCTLVSNSCYWAGGGAYSATLVRSLVAFNKSTDQNGGGAQSCTLSDCVLTGNSSAYNGAAIYAGSALRCVITNNVNGRIGGGVVYNSITTQCLIKDNGFIGGYNGGVVNGGKLINCLLIGNKSTPGNLANHAASAYKSQIFNSTVADTSSGRTVSGCTLINSIVRVGSLATADFQNNYATNSCIAAAAVASGENNIDADPKFMGAGAWPYRLEGTSPCIDKGIGGFDWMLPADPNTHGLDFSGRRRVIGAAVDMGAFEFMPQGSALLVR